MPGSTLSPHAVINEKMAQKERACLKPKGLLIGVQPQVSQVPADGLGHATSHHWGSPASLSPPERPSKAVRDEGGHTHTAQHRAWTTASQVLHDDQQAELRQPGLPFHLLQRRAGGRARGACSLSPSAGGASPRSLKQYSCHLLDCSPQAWASKALTPKGMSTVGPGLQRTCLLQEGQEGIMEVWTTGHFCQSVTGGRGVSTGCTGSEGSQAHCTPGEALLLLKAPRKQQGRSALTALTTLSSRCSKF